MENMGRPKNFSREELLEKAIPVFWKRGFSHTTVEDLERATGVNKSGLYSEFRGKEDLFVDCLLHYLATQAKRQLLTKEPLGWKNIETFLKLGPHSKGEQKGCFSISSMREFAILPDEVHAIVARSRAAVKRLLVKNIQAEGSKKDPDSLAEMVLVFYSGLCIEHNLKSGKNTRSRKIESLMRVLRSL
jgi:AcrR family transcriptional regulator